MVSNCTLLVNSYDGGEDLWEGFFTCLTHQWPELDLPIVLNTESKSYAFPGLEIQTLALYPDGGKNIPWGKRMIETLKRIDTEYVLFFLEDFWLEQPVDDAFFRQCLQWMQENPDVANLSFQPTWPPNIQDGRFERFERRPRNGAYLLNCQAALWRRKRLIQFLRPKESPWDWEIWASRMRGPRYRYGFYSLQETAKQVFPYDLDQGGVVHRGKWNRDVVVPIQQRYDLQIDYTQRGFEVWDESEESTQPLAPETLWTKLTKPHLLSRLKASAKARLSRLRFWL